MLAPQAAAPPLVYQGTHCILGPGVAPERFRHIHGYLMRHPCGGTLRTGHRVRDGRPRPKTNEACCEYCSCSPATTAS